MSAISKSNLSFYKKVLAIAVPIMLQSGISTFVSLLDNIMVGQLGTEQMSGVAIANQLFFVFNMVLFGGMSGAGIFAAQYHGKGDVEGLRNVFRVNLWIALIASSVTIFLFQFKGAALLGLFLQGSGDTAAALAAGMAYLGIIQWMLLPFALLNAYTMALFSTGKTVPAMNAGIVAVCVNLVLDYLLIFGKFGFPALGVRGAALATLIARMTECAVLAGWTHLHAAENPFIQGAYRTLRVPVALVKDILRRGVPLLVNEALYSMAVTTMLQCYSLRGLEVVAAVTITTTIGELFDIGLIALGNATGVIVGNLLGAGEAEQARQTDRRLIRFSLFMTLPLAVLLFFMAPLFPQLYAASDIVRQNATAFLRVVAFITPFHAITNACYFTLRCGGKTLLTFLFDSVFLWVLAVPCAWVLARSGVSVVLMYGLSQGLAVLKSVIGLVLVRSGIWVRTLVNKPANS